MTLYSWQPCECRLALIFLGSGHRLCSHCPSRTGPEEPTQSLQHFEADLKLPDRPQRGVDTLGHGVASWLGVRWQLWARYGCAELCNQLWASLSQCLLPCFASPLLLETMTTSITWTRVKASVTSLMCLSLTSDFSVWLRASQRQNIL